MRITIQPFSPEKYGLHSPATLFWLSLMLGVSRLTHYTQTKPTTRLDVCSMALKHSRLHPPLGGYIRWIQEICSQNMPELVHNPKHAGSYQAHDQRPSTFQSRAGKLIAGSPTTIDTAGPWFNRKCFTFEGYRGYSVLCCHKSEFHPSNSTQSLVVVASVRATCAAKPCYPQPDLLAVLIFFNLGLDVNLAFRTATRSGSNGFLALKRVMPHEHNYLH